MDFNFSEDQNAIRELAGQIFGDRATDEFLLSFSREGATYDEPLWQTLAGQGLLGIAVPEAAGGSGLGLVELCLVLEEQGRCVAPVPVFASLVLGGLPIAEFGSEAQQQRLLGPMVAGEAKLTAAIAELGMTPALAGQVTATREGDGWVLKGERAAVPDGAVASHILVPATTSDDKSCVFVVPTDADGVSITPVGIGMSGERAAHLELEYVALDGEALLGEEGQGGAIMDWLEQRANVAHCALQVGVTEEAMRRTAAYVSERKQFGVPLGTFQALAMRMADSYIDVEAIRSTYWHGGMGADVEYPIHRFYLLAKQISYSLGNAAQQLDQLGKLLAADDSLGFRALEVQGEA